MEDDGGGGGGGGGIAHVLYFDKLLTKSSSCHLHQYTTITLLSSLSDQPLHYAHLFSSRGSPCDKLIGEIHSIDEGLIVHSYSRGGISLGIPREFCKYSTISGTIER